MAVTNQAQEYKRLRSYLNPAIKGPNVDAVLNALAAGNSSYLINNAAAVNDQMYIVTASGVYLDQLLNAYGINRPEAVGLSDNIFSQIGIQVKNRKQVRDLINQILNIMFGNELTKASNDSTAVEPYALADGDTLIINFDEAETVTVTFSTAQFENINAALAIEVADAITEALSSGGYTGSATTGNDGNGNYVELLSSTIGPASSVTVLGGSAQNQLLFPTVISAGGNSSTEWTISQQPGGIIRFTWTNSLTANPLIGKVEIGDYVNIYGGGFLNSGLEGTYTITAAVGGAAGVSYFEVQNILASTPSYTFTVSSANATVDAVYTNNGQTFTILNTFSGATKFSTTATGAPSPSGVLTLVSGIGDATISFSTQHAFNPVTQGGTLQDPAILFFNPTRQVLASLNSYAAVYQAQGSILQIFLPAATKVIGRTRLGTAHIHYPPTEVFTFSSQPNPGDSFSITTTNTLVAGSDFAIGATITDTVNNLAAAINLILPTNYMFTVSEANPTPSLANVTAEAIYSNNGQTFVIIDTVSGESQLSAYSTGAPLLSGTLTRVSGTGDATIQFSAAAAQGVVAVSEAQTNGTVILTVFQDSPELTLTGTYAGSAAITGSGLIGDPTSVIPNQPGPYGYDTTQPFSVSYIGTVLTQNLDGTDSRVFTVENASNFPNAPGYLIFDYGYETQEGPVPYVGRPSDSTLLISPAYTIQTPHTVGANVSIAYKTPVAITSDGLDYPFYVTDVVSGRVYAQQLINSIAATGINIVFTILYPSDIGLGKWGTQYTENPIVWGD